MPLYEYECLKCGQRFEQIQKFSDPSLKHHPECGGEVRKLLSAPAIQFKGTGWYITDYARAGKTDGKADAKAEKDSKAEKSDKKTDAKPETKSSASSDSGSTAAAKPSSSDSSKK